MKSVDDLLLFDQESLQRIKERFDLCYHKNDSGCWIWEKSSWITNKYGRFAIGAGSYYPATRVSFVLHKREPIGELFVCHTCDVPLCVNPDHLWKGTHIENMHDMISKGRDRHLRGSKNGVSKLVEDEVREIRRKHADGISNYKLAKMFGVSTSCIADIIWNRTWVHV